MTWFYKHRYVLFIAIGIIFMAGMFAGFGSYVFLRSPQDTAIKVNDAKISMEQYERTVNEIAAQSPHTPSEAELSQIRKAAVQEVVREEAFGQETEAHQIKVVDQELAAFIESIPAFQKDGHFDETSYVNMLRYNLHMTPEQFEAARKRELAFRKLQLFMGLAVQVPKTEFPEAVQWSLSSIKDPKELQKIKKDPKAL